MATQICVLGSTGIIVMTNLHAELVCWNNQIGCSIFRNRVVRSNFYHSPGHFHAPPASSTMCYSIQYSRLPTTQYTPCRDPCLAVRSVARTVDARVRILRPVAPHWHPALVHPLAIVVTSDRRCLMLASSRHGTGEGVVGERKLRHEVWCTGLEIANTRVKGRAILRMGTVTDK